MTSVIRLTSDSVAYTPSETGSYAAPDCMSCFHTSGNCGRGRKKKSVKLNQACTVQQYEVRKQAPGVHSIFAQSGLLRHPVEYDAVVSMDENQVGWRQSRFALGNQASYYEVWSAG